MKAITDTLASLSTIFGEEERCIAANLSGRAAQLASEDSRLLRERERVAVEESYIADEERALSEQTAEVEELIATQGGDDSIRRAELESKQGKLSYISTVTISPYHFPILFLYIIQLFLPLFTCFLAPSTSGVCFFIDHSLSYSVNQATPHWLMYNPVCTAELDIEIEELEKKLRLKKAEKKASLMELDRVNER